MDQATNAGKTKWLKFGDIQLFARRDESGKPTRADAINEDESQICALADQLQKAGYGVLRERVPRAGRVYHRLRAVWAAAGDPPEKPFSL
jgi:hypothetical protein